MHSAAKPSPISMSTPVRGLQRFAAEMLRQIKAHSLVIALCLGFYAVSIGMNFHFNQAIGTSFWPYFSVIFTMVLPVAFVAIFFVQLVYMALVQQPESPGKEMGRFYKSLLFDHRRWAKVIPVVLFMLLAFDAFTNLKNLIPLVNPYSWDVAFMEMDRAIHFGQDPWRLLQPLFGSALVTQVLSFLYIFWFIFLFVFWLAAASTQKDKGWERQYLVSMLLVWIVGGVGLAMVFSSMGPAFYDLVDPVNNPFAAQMASLSELHESRDIWALSTQDMLRDAYVNPSAGKLAGISAMPSMHNATSALFMFAAFRIHKGLGWIMAAFLAVIVIGSVHLAWHYAVDAYAGILIAWAMWWLSGKLVKLQDRLMGPKTT